MTVNRVFRFLALLLGASLQLTAGSAAADVATPELTDILAKVLTHEQALAVCREHKMRLPTARELAMAAPHSNANKIIETKYPNVPIDSPEVQREIAELGNTKFVYYPVLKLNAAKKITIDFYWTQYGYQRPMGENGARWFWSASIHPVQPAYAYVFYGYTGGVEDIDRTYAAGHSSVRCVRPL